MGNCASSDGEKGKQRPNEDPELMGKSKFLSCPSMSEITDPSQNKWLLIVFAPLTHHGLIFAARSAKDGMLLVKDVVDKQVAKEKEDQRVQLSYNLFFKAISTEVAKAGRSGAKVDWAADGSLSVECKIAISGSASSSKKPDTYTAVLKPIEATEANLFKYVVEPLATHYCKKRTDGWNLDRPDPHKEKMYGEQEANAIMRSASMRASQKLLDQELPTIAPLRQEHATARAECDAAVAKVNLMKQMLLSKSVSPPLMRLPPDDAFATVELTDTSLNAIAAAQEPHFAFPTCSDITSVVSRTPSPPMSVPSVAFDDMLETLPENNALYATVMSAMAKLDLVGTQEHQIDVEALRGFAYRLEALHRSSNPFHNADRAAERFHTFVVLVRRIMDSGFKPERSLLFAAIVGAAIHDADHCGLNNQQGSQSRFSSYVPTLYSFESHVERHSLAVGLCEALAAGIQPHVDTVAAVVLSTDLSKHQEFMQTFARRSREIADFSRRQDDQVLAFSCLLKVADLCHIYRGQDDSQAAMRDLRSELRSGSTMSGIDQADGDVDLSLFVKHVGMPLFVAAASAFPTMSLVVERAKENFASLA